MNTACSPGDNARRLAGLHRTAGDVRGTGCKPNLHGCRLEKGYVLNKRLAMADVADWMGGEALVCALVVAESHRNRRRIQTVRRRKIRSRDRLPNCLG